MPDPDIGANTALNKLAPRPSPGVDWGHIVIGGLAVLAPAELHYLMGLPWDTLAPSAAATITGALTIANELLPLLLGKS